MIAKAVYAIFITQTIIWLILSSMTGDIAHTAMFLSSFAATVAMMTAESHLNLKHQVESHLLEQKFKEAIEKLGGKS